MMKDSWVFQRRIFSEISRICLIRMQTYFHSVRELLQLVKVESRRSSEEMEMKVEAISVCSQPRGVLPVPRILNRLLSGCCSEWIEVLLRVLHQDKITFGVLVGAKRGRSSI